jgi:hypothetical protein
LRRHHESAGDRSAVLIEDSAADRERLADLQAEVFEILAAAQRERLRLCPLRAKLIPPGRHALESESSGRIGCCDRPRASSSAFRNHAHGDSLHGIQGSLLQDGPFDSCHVRRCGLEEQQ